MEKLDLATAASLNTSTHISLTPGPPGARRKLHYLEEERVNDVHKGSSRDQSRHCHTHA
jgi:hypothetical protein